MTANREEILAAGQERLMQALLKMRHLHNECMAAAFEDDRCIAAGLEVERIRRQVEVATGVSLIDPVPLPQPIVDQKFRALVESASFPEGLI